MTATFTLAALNDELERRIELEYADKTSFEQLPRLVLVIDEFPALFVGLEKAVSKTLTNVISSFLQRGGHAKIHVVLAAQNPTFQNMKVDLGNITARIAFKCAKKNFSEIILGEGGAENLLGRGDLLLRSPRFDGPQRIQGIYIIMMGLSCKAYLRSAILTPDLIIWTRDRSKEGVTATVKERKLNYRIHDPNPAAVTTDYILKILIEANAGKVEAAIQNAAAGIQAECETDNCREEHPA